MSEAKHGSTPTQRASWPYKSTQHLFVYRKTMYNAQSMNKSSPKCITIIQRILFPTFTQNTTPLLDILLPRHNIHPGHINQHNTSLYIGEQLPPSKHTATLSLEGTIYIHPWYPNIFEVKIPPNY